MKGFKVKQLQTKWQSFSSKVNPALVFQSGEAKPNLILLEVYALTDLYDIFYVDLTYRSDTCSQ